MTPAVQRKRHMQALAGPVPQAGSRSAVRGNNRPAIAQGALARPVRCGLGCLLFVTCVPLCLTHALPCHAICAFGHQSASAKRTAPPCRGCKAAPFYDVISGFDTHSAHLRHNRYKAPRVPHARQGAAIRQHHSPRCGGLSLAGQTARSTIIFLISAIAFAGFRPLGQVLVQFMMVWQRYSLNGSSNSSRRSPVASSRLSMIQR